nr:IS3 family transposase [Megamonas funiformis]
MTKYSNEFKVKAIKDIAPLCRCISHYEHGGIPQLLHKNRKYTPIFKQKVIEYKWLHHLSLNQSAAKFSIPNTGTISTWEKLYHSYGFSGLLCKKRGRPSMKKSKSKNKVNKPKKELSYVEKLEQEVYQLRMENDLLKKWHALMKQWEKEKTLVLVIAKLRKKYTLKALLNYTKLAKSTYYDALKKLSREDKYKGLKTLIHNICNKNHGRYGYRRVTMQLHKQGIKINHKVVMRLMKEENLTCKVRAKKYKSYRGQEGKIAKNILNRNFKAEKPNEKWATDVTEFALCNEKIYLSPIIDLYNGEIISYKISKRPILKQVLDMVEDATRKIKEAKGIILHSDQGWQYQNKRYQKLLKEKGIIQSMSRKGNCLDNAVIENFFGLLKSELFYLKKFKSVEDFIKELKSYIKYYNTKRIKIKLKGLSPVEYRIKFQLVA